MPAAEDTQTNTVMTYNLDWDNAQSLGMFDLAAVHALYGVDHAARSGSNTYHLSDRYIWDGAGADMLDGSTETQRLNIKLSEGSWIWAGAQSTSILDEGQAFIGYGTLIERAKGGSAGDVLQGNASNNLLFGNAGFDLMWGLAGNDSLFGGVGNDRLFGGTGDDALYGSGGHDSLVGGNGNDALTAGVGNDILVGGLGRDTLSGGDGADVFRYFSRQEAGNGGGRDLITDFSVGVDQLDLQALDANETLAGDQSFSFIGGAAFSGQVGELRYVQGVGAVAGDGILMGDVNGDRVADLQIQLVGKPLLLESDLILSA